ncbi:MAG: choice-of-anchor L domain-containing protein [Deltaproteobacteria bacterium]|nr:choice-of-anchor L domain-containing protein [Deltaproteobacteria bacterium]
MRPFPRLLVPGGLVFGAAMFLACSSTTNRTGFPDETSSSGGTSGTSGILGGGGDSGTGKPCAPGAGNWDIPGNNCDDDGDGTVDNPPECDDAITPGAATAEDFAKALGICATAAKDGYGVVKAELTRGYGSTQAPNVGQAGVLTKFGNVIKPREGKKLAALSTGYASEYDSPGGTQTSFAPGKGWNYSGQLPPGFPKAASGCDQATDTNDVVNLKLTLKAPKNASGVRFDFNFYSSEWPQYICSEFNDGFLAYLSAKGFNGGKADNISFDSKKNPVSVNNGFFDRCTPNVDIGCAPGAKPATSTCPGGVDELRGTGFGVDGKWCDLGPLGGGQKTSTNGGATGWLTSSAPVAAGEEFTIEFMIWDTGDSSLDSLVLLDNFKWAEGEVTVITDRPR